MTSLGRLIRAARKSRHWSAGKLAQHAQEMPGAPVIEARDVYRWETDLRTLNIDEPGSSLPWILAALQLSDAQICRALGLGSGRRAA